MAARFNFPFNESTAYACIATSMTTVILEQLAQQRLHRSPDRHMKRYIELKSQIRTKQKWKTQTAECKKKITTTTINKH